MPSSRYHLKVVREKERGTHLVDELLSTGKSSSRVQRRLLVLETTDDVDPALLCRRVMREVDSTSHRGDLLVGGDLDVGNELRVWATDSVCLHVISSPTQRGQISLSAEPDCQRDQA
jgi:hypothetical protein